MKTVNEIMRDMGNARGYDAAALAHAAYYRDASGNLVYWASNYGEAMPESVYHHTAIDVYDLISDWLAGVRIKLYTAKAIQDRLANI